MAEYIERSAVLQNKTTMTEYDEGGWDAPVSVVRVEDIEAIPAADVAPVVHGRWVMTIYTTTSKRRRIISNKKFACSECGYGNGRKQSNYCPNCGAKMDAELLKGGDTNEKEKRSAT